MKLKEIIRKNIKLYIILEIIIVLGTLGITFAFSTEFNPIAVNLTTNTIDADITYDDGTNSSIITTTGGEILPIEDAIIEEYGESIDNTKVIKAQFNVAGLSTNPAQTIYDVALYEESPLDCILKSEDVKWRLYKNSELISEGNLSPQFDTMDNGRLVLTNIQQDLTTTPDKYTFLLWISESCPGDLSTCNPSQDQSKYLNKKINVSLKIELATKTKKTLVRTTSTEESCNYTDIEIPACNTLTYNREDQTLINESNYYTISNNIGKEVGSYSTIIKLNDGYKWQDGTIEDKRINCNIRGAKLTITPIEQNTSYGSYISTNTNQVTAEGLLEGDTLSSILLKQNSLAIGTNVITASNAVIIDSEGNDVTNNYNITYKKNNVNVNCQNISSLPTTTDYKYTGETFNGVTGGEYIDIKGVTTAVEAGTYTIYVTPKENYCWPDSTTVEKTLTWTIQSDVTTISLDNGVTQINGTSAIYERDGKYYTNSNATKLMTTTSNPIILPQKAGYTFEGYYTEEDGNGTQMIDSNGYATEALLNQSSTQALSNTENPKPKAMLLTNTMPIENSITLSQGITLYAYWTQKEYTITFNANGGTGEVPSPQTKLHGETITIPETTLEKGELPFLGWSTNKNATSATFLSGSECTINGNVTLYAIYVTPQPFTITSSNRTMIGYTSDTTELTIPEIFQADDGIWYKVTTINPGAFENCDNLTNVTIPEGVTSIGSYAFRGCDNLTNITIPEGVTSIGDSAFSGCKSLTSVVIPNGITTINNATFYGCTNLTSVVIPNSVTKIDSTAFCYCNLTNVTIPDSVVSIGDSAFYDCNLTSVTIPDSVTELTGTAFDYCNALTNINVDPNNKKYSSIDGIVYDVTKKTIIMYPRGRRDETVIIPDGVTSIGNYALSSMFIKNITIPDSVTSIGSGAFRYSSITNITIPEGVKSIGGYAFENCDNLTNVTIPEGVTSIRNGLFANCDNLTNITIPDSVTSIGAYAFMGCNNLTNITIPDSVTSIEDFAFIYSGITNITIPDSVTSIGANAFNGCRSLKSIRLSNNITSIKEHMFANCDNLTNITIPDSVTSIGYKAFEDCSSLTSITIPDNVTSIGGFAFYGCSSLTNVYYTGSQENWGLISIGEYNEDLTNATLHYNYVAS